MDSFLYSILSSLQLYKGAMACLFYLFVLMTLQNAKSWNSLLKWQQIARQVRKTSRLCRQMGDCTFLINNDKILKISRFSYLLFLHDSHYAHECFHKPTAMELEKNYYNLITSKPVWWHRRCHCNVDAGPVDGTAQLGMDKSYMQRRS